MKRWDVLLPFGLFVVSAAASFMRVAYAAEAMFAALLLIVVLPLLRRTRDRGTGYEGGDDGEHSDPSRGLPGFSHSPAQGAAIAGTAHEAQALDGGVDSGIDVDAGGGLDGGIDFGGIDFGGGDFGGGD